MHDVKGVTLEHASSVSYGGARYVNKKQKNVMCAMAQFHPSLTLEREVSSPMRRDCRRRGGRASKW